MTEDKYRQLLIEDDVVIDKSASHECLSLSQVVVLSVWHKQ
jgi:hypothetical protein